MDYSFFILIISIFASRFIQLNAFRTLDDEDKGKVLSKNILQLSQASVIFTVVIVGAFFLLVGKYPERSITITSTFFIALILQRVIVYILTRKRMIENGVSPVYINKHFFSWLVATIGVALFIVLFMQQHNNGAE